MSFESVHESYPSESCVEKLFDLGTNLGTRPLLALLNYLVCLILHIIAYHCINLGMNSDLSKL